MVTQLSATGYNVPSPSELDSILRQCAITLSIASLPKLFVIEGDELNAFTFGSEEDAYLVLDASLLRTLTQLELMAVIAHELGHVKSGHMVYHTLAEALGRGISISAALMGLNVISIPLQLALLSWHRQSEVTADRASLLVVKEIEILQALLTKIASSHRAAIPQNSSVQTRNGGLLETAAGLFRTHPAEIDRFTLAKEFQTSQEFSAANRKVELRQRLLRGLIPVCRFCGERKRVEDLFCLKCGKCQT
jgi:Zn-dependent protease with chaperone function